MWVKYKGMQSDHFVDGYDFLTNHRLSMIRACETPLIDAVLGVEALANRAIIANRPIGSICLSDLRLIDMVLHDGTVIKVPGAIDLDVEEYFCRNMKLFSEMEGLYKGNKGKRIHMPPDALEFRLI